MLIEHFLGHVNAIAIADSKRTGPYDPYEEGWGIQGSEQDYAIRRGCDCPILAVAKSLGIDPCDWVVSNVNAGEIGTAFLGLTEDDTDMIIEAADKEEPNLEGASLVREWLLEAIGM